MTCVACVVEEQSAKEMLSSVLPRILPEDRFEIQFVLFEGKQDLDKNLERKLRVWQRPNTVFLVLRDQDSGDCRRIKETLLTKVNSAGKASRTVVRIACQELESFYLGDLHAVEMGLGIRGLAASQNRRNFRKPDTLGNPKEVLKILTKKGYQVVAGSRAIAPHLDIQGSNKSHSFGVLLNGIQSLARMEEV